jgi:hypothetical protein
VRVTAALSWWNEKPEDLVACVRGMADVADRVVALDGAYRRYPNGTARSDGSQVEAIRETALAAGLDPLIIQPSRTWTGEIEKRSALLALAASHSDWVVVVDADHIIHADKDAVREEMKSSGVDVFDVPFFTPVASGTAVEKVSATNWHRQQANSEVRYPLLFRSLPGITVEKRHWWYSAYKDGAKVWLSGGDEGPSAVHGTFRSRYTVEHRCLMRSEEQMLAARAWYNDRVKVVEATGQEDFMPGLPEPAYDYETIPY